MTKSIIEIAKAKAQAQKVRLTVHPGLHKTPEARQWQRTQGYTRHEERPATTPKKRPDWRRPRPI